MITGLEGKEVMDGRLLLGAGDPGIQSRAACRPSFCLSFAILIISSEFTSHSDSIWDANVIIAVPEMDLDIRGSHQRQIQQAIPRQMV